VIKMITDLRIYVIIGIFMIACIALMIFNFTIIHYSKSRNTPSGGKVAKWKAILYKEINTTSDVRPNELKHEKFLLRKLSKPERLIAYAHALQYLKSEFPEAYNSYIQKKHTVFQKLAYIYGRKSRIERTCYADFICAFPQTAGDTPGQLVDTLISYIDDSNIHCRTKVLGALCSIGSVPGVANVLQLIHDRGLFMHNQLLTNELLKFSGDQEILGESLWSESRKWNDNITVSVIQFITRVSPHYCEAFLPVLQDSSASSEVRIAIIHYYGEHAYEPARPILTELIANSTDMNLTTAAELVLGLHPTLVSDALAIQMNELSGSNWHVQHNICSPLLNKVIDRMTRKFTA